VHDRLGDRVEYFPRNQEELEEMANARVPDEFIFCRDANTHRMESRENHRLSVRQQQLPPWCPEGLTRTQKRRLQHERREELNKGDTLLNEALWSYRMACHGSTKVSPYQLVYGHDAVLPWEIKTGSRRLSFQDQLATDDYATLMTDELDDLAGHRLKALMSIEENKKRVARWYDKKVKAKEFADGDLVWKLILPIGTKSSKFGKWSPNWEGPYRISRSAPGNAYILETLEGVEFPRALNGKYLKKY